MIDGLHESPADEEIRAEASMLAHSIKGSGKTYGFDLVTTIATAADDLLGTEGGLETAHLRALDNHVAALSLIARNRISGDGGEAGRILLQGLKDFS
jgi:chemotaxis protein histidine kinase CheA